MLEVHTTRQPGREPGLQKNMKRYLRMVNLFGEIRPTPYVHHFARDFFIYSSVLSD